MSKITEEYRKMQQDLHKNRPDYGIASVSFAPQVSNIINDNNIRELLDYGAGKGRLAQNLKVNHQVNIQLYDPAIPEWSEEPDPKEMVCCIDVLEHIEPELLDNVLDDLKRVTKRVGFFTVHTGPAVKILPDGRNAHLIQEPSGWWLPKFLERFELISFSKVTNGFLVIVEPLK
ncbi:methyltransferase domain-containing protein [Litoribrevibacter euphylliae]|uniref:Methyltransferase domain-containing protein n=1 Tax=Litoribrevibacter euphylliae TaxID=1834034 RepID=A0ABV7HC57_9GAMM